MKGLNLTQKKLYDALMNVLYGLAWTNETCEQGTLQRPKNF